MKNNNNNTITEMTNILESVKFGNLNEKVTFIVNNFVTKDTHYLNKIPENCKTYQFYSEALKKNSDVIHQVPEKFINADLLETTIKTNYNLIKNIPKQWKHIEIDHDLYYKIVEQNPLLLEFVPNVNKTPGLCEYAVTKNGKAFKFLPKELQTPEMAELAISQLKSKKKTTFLTPTMDRLVSIIDPCNSNKPVEHPHSLVDPCNSNKSTPRPHILDMFDVVISNANLGDGSKTNNEKYSEIIERMIYGEK